MESVKIYVDLHGDIWKGYLTSESNLHYARFGGVTDGRKTGIIQLIWILERTESDPSWILIGEEKI